ncbi:MAG TPA: TIR domain-containing protein [Sphingomicrobium sp.]|nr:TIR domain-containing protein [Sphingomicrobium sp.]
MAALFLSYSREDANRVRPLALALERAGHQVWWDREIAGGEEFSGAIERALEAADAVIVAWSAASVRSAWVRDEAAAGRDSGRLVPVTLDGCLPPLGFRQFQTVDLSKWTGRSGSRALQPLFAAIDKTTRASGVGDAASRPPAPGTAFPRIPRRAALSAGLMAVVLLAGGLIYSRVAASGGISPKVALGSFTLVSPGLPPDLPSRIGQEVVAAFGAENGVALMTADKSSSAPYLLEGSISSVGPATRYTVNLKNRQSGILLWSATSERHSADVLAPRQVAVQATQVVRCALWGAAAYKWRMSDEALSLYFKWCGEHWGGSSDEKAELDAARAVTAALPKFSFGWSARALAAVPLAQQAMSADAPQFAKEAEEAARKSIALDDQNPEGYMALAGLMPLTRYSDREALLKKAIGVRGLECGCERLSYGDFLASVGRVEEAAEEYGRGHAKMPLAPFSNIRLAHALYATGREDRADKILSELTDIWPDASDVQLLRVKSAFWTKRYADALAALGSSEIHLARMQRDALNATFTALDKRTEESRRQALTLLGDCAADPKRTDRLIVAAFAALGAHDLALKTARQLIANRGHRYADVLFEPNLAAARATPAYGALVAALGLPGYWRSTGQKPDICRGANAPDYC